jgi:hypothetical protein
VFFLNAGSIPGYLTKGNVTDSQVGVVLSNTHFLIFSFLTSPGASFAEIRGKRVAKTIRGWELLSMLSITYILFPFTLYYTRCFVC